MPSDADIYRNSPDSHGQNSYLTDPELARLLRIYAGEPLLTALEDQFVRLGALAGGALETLALTADRNGPELQLRARTGAPEETLRKHPSYVEMERIAFSEFGLAAMSHRPGVFGANDRLPPVIKYALTFLFVQAEFGLCCPLSMTDSLTRTLSKFGSEELIARYLPALTSQDFDALFQGAMFITEQAAGSDVGAITTEARLEDGTWRLYGDKWFCSNVDADLAMVLARPEGGAAGTKGLSLFLLPRRLPDGSPNAYRIVRLKEKLGSRSMATGEIELNGAVAYLVGEPASGFKQMTDMINMSRLSNGVRAAGMMRRAVAESLFIARHRTAFGKNLIDLPLMRRQLIKMLLTAEQARSMVLHAAECLRRADAGDEEAQKLIRILTPLIKFRACRDARKVTGDAMEVRGGSGYVEEWSDARLLRDAHLGSIWEGTSNIVALDVSRGIRNEGTLEALRVHLAALLETSDLPAETAPLFDDLLGKVMVRMEQVATTRPEEQSTRQAASALYHLCSAVFMAWEASQMPGRANRLALALLVLREKLLPRDPLADAPADDALIEKLLQDAPLTPQEAASVPRS